MGNGKLPSVAVGIMTFWERQLERMFWDGFQRGFCVGSLAGFAVAVALLVLVALMARRSQ